MRIAEVAPLTESVPPKRYGGTERSVSYLTEELVRLGHEVTLFASGDSRTRARLISTVPRALRGRSEDGDRAPCNILQLEQVRQLAKEFDIINFHYDFLHFPLVRAAGLDSNAVSTLHGRCDLPNHKLLLDQFPDMPLTSISNHQRRPLAPRTWVATIYHGLPPHICAFRPEAKGDYVAFLGRISPEKRPDRAIEIARRAGFRLKIAAKVDSVDVTYYQERIKPLLTGSDVDFLGEIGEDEKSEFLGNARAMLFPIDWPEPFGVVLIEAMSCGTPVIAWRCGSVPEVIEHGVTGFIVESINEAVEALRQVGRLNRRTIRQQFEKRFSVTRMANEYLDVYSALARTPARQESDYPLRSPSMVAAQSTTGANMEGTRWR